MATFKFRLATLLRLRETARDDRRSELAEAFRVDDALSEQVDDIERKRVQVRRECQQAASPGTVDIDRLVEAQRFELSLKAQRGNLDQQRQAVAEEIQRRRDRLIEANREVRVLEKLRGKQETRHRRDENRREVKVLDEVAAQRAAREVVQ